MESSSAQSPSPSPEKKFFPSSKLSSKRRVLLLVSGVALALLILGLIGWSALYLLQDSAQEDSSLSAPLPSSLDTDVSLDPTAQEPPFSTAPPETTPISVPVTSPVDEDTHVAVTIKYTSSPQFSMSVTEAKTTKEQSTYRFYIPPEGSPYSILRILNSSGKVLFEEKFSVATHVILDSPDNPGGVAPLTDGTARIVAPIPAGSIPAAVQILTPERAVREQKMIGISSSSHLASPHPLNRLIQKMKDKIFSVFTQPTANNGFITRLLHFMYSTPAQAQATKQLELTILGEQTGCVYEGQNTRRFQVKNTSQSTASNVEVLFTIHVSAEESSHLTLVSASPSADATYPIGKGYLWYPGSLGPGESITYEVMYNIGSGFPTDHISSEYRVSAPGFQGQGYGTLQPVCLPSPSPSPSTSPTAAPTARPPQNRYTIIIINEIGGEAAIPATVEVTRQMLNVHPWKKYADRIDIVPISNSSPLNCTLFAGSYPMCPDQDAVFSAVEDGLREQHPNRPPTWDTIIVTTNVDCNCGSVAAPPIAAVGSSPSVQLVTHELGHSVGEMVDEYVYQRVSSDTPPYALDANCFMTEVSCKGAIEPFAGNPAAQCSPGCSGGVAVTWRPATRIMHNTYNPLEFGPLEACLMEVHILEGLGEGSGDFECGGRALQETYWGWRRGL